MPSCAVLEVDLDLPLVALEDLAGAGEGAARQEGRADAVAQDDVAVVVELAEHDLRGGVVLLGGRGRHDGGGHRRGCPGHRGRRHGGRARHRGGPGRGRRRRRRRSWWHRAAVVAPGTVVAPATVVVGGHGGAGDRHGLALVGRQRLQHGTEAELGRLAHDLEGPVLVLHAGQVHDDGVALAGDLGLGHAEAVDAVADDVDRRCRWPCCRSPPWAAARPTRHPGGRGRGRACCRRRT